MARYVGPGAHAAPQKLHVYIQQLYLPNGGKK